MRIIYLIRHGRVGFPNGIKRCIGRTDLLLDDWGKRQAEDLREYFRLHPVKHIYCSQLTRSIETARILGGWKTDGRDGSRIPDENGADRMAIPVRIDQDLQELDMGEWENVPMADLDKTLEQEPVKGERRTEAKSRMERAVTRILKETDGDVAVVAHAGINCCFLAGITGSPLETSRALFQPYGGISRIAVRELENELGIRVLARSNRGVEFTPEGKEFLSYAVSLLEQKRGIESLYGEARNAAAPVRFSVSCQRYPFAVDAFLRLLRIAGENRFRFGLRETGMDGVIDDVYDHRADVGVICLTDLTEKIICRLLDARELEFHELAAVCPCIYVRGGHPLAGRSSVTEEELDGYPYVAFEHDQGVASDFFEEYPMVSLEKPAKCISVNNRATAMYVLASTDAFTSGSGLLSEGLADGSVVTIPLLGKTSVHLGWIHIRSSRPSPLTEQFVRLLEEALADSIAFTRRLQEGT